MNYPIIIYPCEEGGFVAEIPALSGCLAQGETLEETLQELLMVKDLWLETAQKYNQKLPNLETEIAKIKALSTVQSIFGGIAIANCRLDLKNSYLTGFFAFNHDEFVIILRYANTSYRATILVSDS